MKENDIAWAAGLIEADGCLTIMSGYPAITVGMTDEDIVRRLPEIFGVGRIYRYGQNAASPLTKFNGVNPRSTDGRLEGEPMCSPCWTRSIRIWAKDAKLVPTKCEIVASSTVLDKALPGWYLYGMPSPKQHDEATAALYFELAKAEQNVAQTRSRIIREADLDRTVRETARGWGSEDIYHDFAVAFDIVEAKDVNIVAAYENAEIEKGRIECEIEAMEAQYTGWSRFFVVTSSQGHIHSSMRCSSCFRTTTYGWLPELSGDTEEQAVEALGPNLCSICFPSAPTEHIGGKIKNAEELAWAPDRAEKAARREAEKQAKAEAKAKKAANALKTAERTAHKVNEIVDRFGEAQQDAYRWTWDVKGYDTAYNVYSDMLRRKQVYA